MVFDSNNLIFKRIKQSKYFERISLSIIFLNALFFGIEVTYTEIDLSLVFDIILLIFIIEFIIRFMGRISNRKFFSNGWNYFDFIILMTGLIPEILLNDFGITVARLFRILRILRILHVSEELRVVTNVLVKSIKSLGYSSILFFLFLYTFSILGVHLFAERNLKIQPQWQANPQLIDPYGSIGEAMFTLFRIMTGDDWADIRYDIITSNPHIALETTIFHVVWVVLSTFLLLNIVIGIIISNFQTSIQEEKQKKL